MASKRLDAWRPVTIVKGDNVEHTACRRDSHLVKGQKSMYIAAIQTSSHAASLLKQDTVV